MTLHTLNVSISFSMEPFLIEPYLFLAFIFYTDSGEFFKKVANIAVKRQISHKV